MTDSNEDLKHTDEFGDIETFKHSGYWFKRDIQTIKRSIAFTLKRIPFIMLVSAGLSLLLLIVIGDSSQGNPSEIFALLAIVFFPLLLLFHFMLDVIRRKGYSVSISEGTFVDNPKHKFRFSREYILRSKLPFSKKMLHLIRLAISKVLRYSGKNDTFHTHP